MKNGVRQLEIFSWYSMEKEREVAMKWKTYNEINVLFEETPGPLLLKNKTLCCLGNALVI
jgi:hypothetical protein